MVMIKRSKNITVAMSELLHQSVSGTNVCKSFHGTNLDLKKKNPSLISASCCFPTRETFSNYS